MNQKSFLTRVRDNFFAGLAVVLPAVISVALLAWLFGNISTITDKLLFFLPPERTHDKNGVVLWYWSFLALVIAVVLICLIGRLTRNYIGEKFIDLADRLMLRVPLLNKVYGTVKQVNDAFSSNKSSFKGVALVPFPHQGSLSLGFITSEQKSPKTGEKMVGVFVPTTPNPTAGFLVFVPENDVTKIDMSVADGIKFIISLGAISPDQQKTQLEKLKT
ncbi:MAG: hypothetical protein JWM68_32 [Verrucomicrobiales bacterium]|nr:hypothetical protein [Verrucomicrobiales bacterium]